ncbi:MAG: PstS family phosphate ABC transporter substrate-binding protein [Mycoplasmataceae bacterium]|nr:PstS family phosphate ABC transporter substrate-binding protein [Mycoplasmataceae bacterium]
MKKRIVKIMKFAIPSFLGFSSFIVTISCFSGVLVKVQTISIGGSTAVLPLVNAFSNVYEGIDIVTSAGGSGVGINSVIEDTKEVGMASKNPGMYTADPSKDKKKELWNEKKIKTVTIAWDGIGIIYRPPKNLDQNQIVDINAESLAKIYASFSGVKKITFGDLMGIDNKTEIIPFARNGGSEVSGTADAFLKDSKIDYKESEYWKQLSKEQQIDIVDKLTNGSYENNVVQTAEANSQAWNRIKNGPEGSMIYLSSGFILNNKEEIEKLGFKIATYNGTQLSENEITKNYNWYRPLNLMYSTTRASNSILEMFKWILFSPESRKVISEQGYVALNEEQISKMSLETLDNLDNIVGTSNWQSANISFLKEDWDYKLGYCGVGESPSSKSGE